MFSVNIETILFLFDPFVGLFLPQPFPQHRAKASRKTRSSRAGVCGEKRGCPGAGSLGVKTTNNKQQPLGIQSYSQLMIGLSNHLLSKVLGFHYHSQKVIGSLGNNNKFYRFYIGGEGNQES